MHFKIHIPKTLGKSCWRWQVFPPHFFPTASIARNATHWPRRKNSSSRRRRPRLAVISRTTQEHTNSYGMVFMLSFFVRQYLGEGESFPSWFRKEAEVAEAAGGLLLLQKQNKKSQIKI